MIPGSYTLSVYVVYSSGEKEKEAEKEKKSTKC